MKSSVDAAILFSGGSDSTLAAAFLQSGLSACTSLPATMVSDGCWAVGLFYDLISRFWDKTGMPILLNTSFNTGGSPIVCAPQNAVQAFLQSGLDALVIGDALIQRDDIPWAVKV